VSSVRPGRGLVISCLAVVPAVAGSAHSDVLLPPWIEEGDLPPPSWARSVGSKPGDPGDSGALTLLAGPSGGSARRGTTLPGASLPFYGARRGSGCSGRWWLVGALAWVCSDDAELLTAEPQSRESQTGDDGLWLQYFFVIPAGTSAYTSLELAREGTSDHELEGGWAVGVAEQRMVDGQRWARTSKGIWLSLGDLVPARPSAFHGTAVEGGRLDFAWVLADLAHVWSDPSPKGKPNRSHVRFERVVIQEDRGPMVRVEDDGWMMARDLARPMAAEPPAQLVAPDEHWIDVDTASETLVAYEGIRPVYATLASTGRGALGSGAETPTGVHRVWVKIRASDMDNVGREEAEENYSMEEVPYVQFFDGAVALHGTYWHGDFGHVRSHGCVNLSPRDARWLFSFTAPRMPAGWAAVFPTPLDPGSIVRVR
jgi:hypothetical protein